MHNLYDKIINNYKIDTNEEFLKIITLQNYYKMCTKYLNLNNYNKTWIYYKLCGYDIIKNFIIISSEYKGSEFGRNISIL